MSRVWAEGDRVAIRDRVDEPWRLGTVTGHTPAGYLLIRIDDGETVDIRHPDDVRVIPADQVVDEWAVALHEPGLPDAYEVFNDEADARRALRFYDGHDAEVVTCTATVTRSPWQPTTP